MKISPSMLACDFSQMGNEIKKISSLGADYIHMDIMDGNFVPNISFGSDVVKSLRGLTTVPFDVHLMIDSPHKYIKQFAEAGANIITFHLESNCNILETIKLIKSYNIKAGLSIKPNTPAEKIIPYLNDIDLALIMTVEPGFGGQKFMRNQLEKSKTIRENSKNILIEIDGGVNGETIKEIKKYPVDICVAGTYVFKAPDIKEAINSIKL
ncbi:MAG: ribulose-phosphate 3-epimerase [Clostridia bacterium]|nr:ribulose-phosphate 3-epimerase [Clostridia bacterium]